MGDPVTFSSGKVYLMQPVFFAAPHRVMFLAGATQALLAVLWWSGVLASRIAPDAIPAALTAAGGFPPSWAHGSLMIFGLYPFFIFGFLMTAMPRWQGAEPVPPRVYVPAFVLMSAGWISFYAGFWLPLFAGPGLAMVLLGWLIGVVDLIRVSRHPNPDRRHASAVVCALVLGALGLGGLLGYLLGTEQAAARAALTVGIWWFLLPVFVTVSHRMIPFFSSSVLPGYVTYRPYWVLYLLLAALFAHGLLALMDLRQWLWLLDLPAAGVALYLSVRWQFRRSFAVRLLAMLHVAFAWLGVALSLFAIQGLAEFAGRPMLGLAPVHALAIGFFGSMLIGMVSRVTLGHSGRALAADRLTWLVFLGVQVVALMRVVGEMVAGAWTNLVALAAACVWLLVFGAWFIKFAPAYWRPRIDRHPG